jgi:hypothetical protein
MTFCTLLQTQCSHYWTSLEGIEFHRSSFSVVIINFENFLSSRRVSFQANLSYYWIPYYADLLWNIPSYLEESLESFRCGIGNIFRGENSCTRLSISFIVAFEKEVRSLFSPVPGNKCVVSRLVIRHAHKATFWWRELIQTEDSSAGWFLNVGMTSSADNNRAFFRQSAVPVVYCWNWLTFQIYLFSVVSIQNDPKVTRRVDFNYLL